MAENEGNGEFKQMMELADFGAKQNEAATQRVFKIFISYMTFLVLAAGFMLKEWNYGWKPDTPQSVALVVGAVVVHGGMLFVYWKWIKTGFTGMIYSVRRRDFYLKKAEVLCYHSSKNLACEIVGLCEDVCLYLGSGEHLKTTEKRLLKTRAPDIENCISPCKVRTERPCKPPKFGGNRYYWFCLAFPAVLASFNVVALVCLVFLFN